MSGSHLSRDFFELVKAIGESKSKQEEDRIIVREVQNLKQRIGEKQISGVSRAPQPCPCKEGRARCQ